MITTLKMLGMKGKMIIALAGWLTISVACFGQSFTGSPEDTAKVNTLLDKGKELAGTQPEQAIAYTEQAKALAERIQYPTGVAYALKNMGLIYFYQSKYLETIQYWFRAMGVFKSINDMVGVSNMLSNIGVIYHTQGDYEKALANHLSSLRAAEQSRNQFRIVTALANIGTCYALKKETYDLALKYYLRALELGHNV
jgi:adenylate cyclase